MLDTLKHGGTDAASVWAVAGNPNVGKSTVFNALTGLRQHTGNWPGKTVANARGSYCFNGKNYALVDIPGTYSLMAHSTEEEVARDFICFGEPDGVMVICDATCLERNLNLVLQVLERTERVIVCVNLMDEACKKHIQIDLNALSRRLGVAVVGTSARSGDGLEELMAQAERLASEQTQRRGKAIRYLAPIEAAIAQLEAPISAKIGERLPIRWLALRLLEGDPALLEQVDAYLGRPFFREMEGPLAQAWSCLEAEGITREVFTDRMVSCIVLQAEEICLDVVTCKRAGYNQADRRLDRLFTSRLTGIPVMLLLLGLIFYVTIVGANLPSRLLSELFGQAEAWILQGLIALGMPAFLYEALVFGVCRVLFWVVAVMLPPMAIFFPLFTLLEDFGYLPRVAFNLDHCFQKSGACGKQALTMAMGFGCNAVGVTGCRIIDSPRERLLAILTNSFVPCNGRFPTLIMMITMFFASEIPLFARSGAAAAVLVGVILLSVGMTFLISRILSGTLLRGIPSSFTLELPSYRRPQIGKVLWRSVFDRTLFVLGRAVSVAAPAGLLIFVLANVEAGGVSLLAHAAAFLDPFACLFGLDGVILMAFILGFPANEIVIPIIIMSYMAQGTMGDMGSIEALRALLVANGWTQTTALCTMLFSLMHWPCSTTCMTIHKETQSGLWTALSLLLPTVVGLLSCFLVATVSRLFFS